MALQWYLRGGLRSMPSGVWALGLASLFMDMSSELVHSLLPLFLVGVMGASIATVGLIEGAAEAIAAITKVFSGAWSDFLGRRKPLVMLGYGLAALTKPVFPLASTVGWVFGARFVDRIGKGIRGAPRDALIADITAPALRGTAYGLRQALDTVGAVLGPVLAIGLMLWLAGNIRTVLWAATLPAVVAMLFVVLAVKEPEQTRSRTARLPISRTETKRLPRRYWMIVALGGTLTLARFSEAFLVLRAHNVGLPAVWVPGVMIVMNVVYALVAVPAGIASDRMSRRTLLAVGLAVLIVADIVLALAPGVAMVLAGAALWGLHMGLTQGLISALVADAAPVELRGTAFGVFHLATGVLLLPASALAGALWTAAGPGVTFGAGAAFAALALGGIAFFSPGIPPGAQGKPHDA